MIILCFNMGSTDLRTLPCLLLCCRKTYY